MPRRRLEPPLVDRVAVILGLPSAASPKVAASSPVGWVPHRTSVDVGAASVPPVVVQPVAGLPAPGLPAEGLPAEGPGSPKPAILTVPVALRGVRAKPGRLAVLGVLVLLLAVGAVFGIRVVLALSSSKPQSIAATAHGSSHGSPGGLVARSVPMGFAPTATAAASATAAVLVVDVVGQVRRRGVVRLAPGSRVIDAVKAAGGPTRSADLNLLNLARVLTDGEQVVVPKPGEALTGAAATGTQGSGTGAPGGSTGGSAGGGVAGALVDLNKADGTALEALPGVGPVLSQRILDWRTAHGRFSSVDELGEVSGIGDKLLAQIGPKVKV